MPGATIGKHLRHILDHYRLLLDALADPATTRLSYDRRVRLTLIESSVPDALDAVRTLQAQLEELDRAGDEWLGRRVTLEAVTPADVEVETTCGREVSPAVCGHDLPHPGVRWLTSGRRRSLPSADVVRLAARDSSPREYPRHRGRRCVPAFDALAARRQLALARPC